MESHLIVGLAALALGLLIGFLAGRRRPPPEGGDARLRAMLETAPIGVIINTRDGRNLYRNSSALDFFRKSEAEFEAGGVDALYANPADRARYIEHLYRDGTYVDEKTVFRRSDGEAYVCSTTSAVTEFAGQRCHITWFHDLTPQLQADAERRDLAARLAMALEATGAAAWDADLVAGTCWWSDTFPRMLGFTDIPDMPPDFWATRLHPQDRDRVMGAIEGHLRGETTLYDYVYRLRREDGSWIWIEAKGSAIRDSQGRALRYVGIMTDISERRRQEELVKASEKRLVRILEAAPISVNISTQDGCLMFSNAQTAKIFGRPVAELDHLMIPALYVDPNAREQLKERYRQEGAFRDAEIAFRRPDGSDVWVLSSWDEIEFEGETAFLTWLYDITDRKAAESELKGAKEAAEKALADLRVAQESLIQAETMASLGQLVAGVAHEINTPVGIGLTAATHIAEETDRIRELFETNAMRRTELTSYLGTVGEGTKLLVTNINRAAELVQSFKQVAVDQSSGERRVFDLRIYIEEVIFSLQPRLKRTGLSVVVDCPEGVRMDSYPGALSQVLTNLTINAVVHAYPEGGSGTIRILAAVDGPVLELRFADDGRGIPPDVLPRIFDPFFTTRRGEGGSGLGLHIVFNTVTRVLHGKVSVESRVGQGTQFTLMLPLTVPKTVAEEVAAPTS